MDPRGEAFRAIEASTSFERTAALYDLLACFIELPNQGRLSVTKSVSSFALVTILIDGILGTPDVVVPGCEFICSRLLFFLVQDDDILHVFASTITSVFNAPATVLLSNIIDSNEKNSEAAALFLAHLAAHSTVIRDQLCLSNCRHEWAELFRNAPGTAIMRHVMDALDSLTSPLATRITRLRPDNAVSVPPFAGLVGYLREFIVVYVSRLVGPPTWKKAMDTRSYKSFDVAGEIVGIARRLLRVSEAAGV
ncbi:hypothetical protein J8273_0731 [Carpediemonas membranifera]|uniref:Uncharacterized protein n=1 Tax=Carpediemonas membranifera TaxID=201153 RepID=A0A8J6E507_9EUKA|nr:hypothetical protein J8273_0731 [Carpediemonas membranifera]|eukprot:KAG9397601.1 hypothetical protein J8273_0731 [Carpediemonas membranifera]